MSHIFLKATQEACSKNASHYHLEALLACQTFENILLKKLKDNFESFVGEAMASTHLET